MHVYDLTLLLQHICHHVTQVEWNNFKKEGKLKVVKVLTSKNPLMVQLPHSREGGRRGKASLGDTKILSQNLAQLHGVPITKAHKMNSLGWFSWGEKAIFFSNLKMVEKLNGCLAILFLSKKELVTKGVYNRHLIDNCQKIKRIGFDL